MQALFLLLGKVVAGFALLKLVKFFVKIGLFFASFKFVQDLIDKYINKIISSLNAADSAAIQLMGIARIDEALSIILSALICGVALKIGGKMFQSGTV